MQYKFQVTNYDCAACGKLAVMATKKIVGVKNVTVDDKGLVTVETDQEIKPEVFVSALQTVEKTIKFIE